jgi:hypothetical protein
MNTDADRAFLEGLMEKKAEEVIPPPAPQAPTPVQPQAPKSLTSRSVFSHPDAHPLALDVVLLKHFELEWLTWLPDTLFFEIEQTFTTSIAEVNKLKILAAQTLHVTDAFWEEWEIFEKTIWALNGMVPRVEVIQPPDLPMLFAGVEMANDIRKETYGEEVSRYCAAVFLYEHVHYAPSPLTFCQPYLTQPTFKCRDCDQTGSALPPWNGVCWSCGGHFHSEHPFKFEPDPDSAGKGRNLDIKSTFDPAPTKRRFEEFDGMDSSKLLGAITEQPEDIQAAKLITAVDFMKHRSQQLAEQLTSLRSWLEMS